MMKAGIDYRETTHTSAHCRDEVLLKAGGRGLKVNRVWGDEATQVKERHSASDFD